MYYLPVLLGSYYPLLTFWPVRSIKIKAAIFTIAIITIVIGNLIFDIWNCLLTKYEICLFFDHLLCGMQYIYTTLQFLGR